MGKTNGEVLTMFHIHRDRLNSIIRRYGQEWKIEKSATGQYTWSAENLARLNDYLVNHGHGHGNPLPMTTGTLVTEPELAMAIATATATALEDKFKALEGYFQAEIEKEREIHSREILELKIELKALRETQVDQAQNLAVGLSEIKATMNLAPKVERRNLPKPWYVTLWNYVFEAPRTYERRKA